MNEEHSMEPLTRHLTEEELISHYYGESSSDIEHHLQACPHCRTEFHTFTRVLNQMSSFAVPARSNEYGAEVWQRLAPSLPRTSQRWWTRIPVRAWGLATAAALVVMAAIALNQVSLRTSPQQDPSLEKAAMADSRAVREKLLEAAVKDHLEQTAVLLTELKNAEPEHADHVDISDQQKYLKDLIATNRLYRQTAVQENDQRTALFLDEVERPLLEVAHSPSQLSRKQFEELQQQLAQKEILFKVRVFNPSALGSGEVNDENTSQL